MILTLCLIYSRCGSYGIWGSEDVIFCKDLENNCYNYYNYYDVPYLLKWGAAACLNPTSNCLAGIAVESQDAEA